MISSHRYLTLNISEMVQDTKHSFSGILLTNYTSPLLNSFIFYDLE